MRVNSLNGLMILYANYQTHLANFYNLLRSYNLLQRVDEKKMAAMLKLQRRSLQTKSPHPDTAPLTVNHSAAAVSKRHFWMEARYAGLAWRD